MTAMTTMTIQWDDYHDTTNNHDMMNVRSSRCELDAEAAGGNHHEGSMGKEVVIKGLMGVRDEWKTRSQ